MKAGVWFIAVAPVCGALILGGCQKEVREQDQNRPAVIAPTEEIVITPKDGREKALLATQVAYYGQLERLGELASTAVHWNGGSERADESNDIGRTVKILKYKGLLERAGDPSSQDEATVKNALTHLAQGESELLRVVLDAYETAGVGRDEQPRYVYLREPVEAFMFSSVATDQDVRAAQLAYYGQLDRLGRLALVLVKRNTIGQGDKIWDDALTSMLVSGHMIPLRFRNTNSPEDLAVAGEYLGKLAETEGKILEMVERAYLEMGVPLEEQPPYVRDRRPVAVFEVQ